MTCYQKISCPECCSTDIMKAGFTGQGKQRYRCRNLECDKSHFLLDYTYRAWVPGIKKQAIDMAINGSGIRDTARVLKIARNTISSTIKKAKTRVHVNSNFFFHASNKDREVRLSQACVEAEVDEQWSNACNKSDQG